MNKYLNIVDVPPVDGCDLISTIDVGMQDICEKALVDKLKELNASVGVVVLMEVSTGEVKAIVNMMQGKDGEYYEMRNNAISDMLEPGSTFKTASIMVALEDGKITPDYVVDTGNGQMPMYGRVMKDHNWHRGGYGKLTVTEPFLRQQPAEICRRVETDEHRPAVTPADCGRRKTEYTRPERTLFCKDNIAVDEYRLRDTGSTDQYSHIL